jgi:hypothetical protein
MGYGSAIAVVLFLIMLIFIAYFHASCGRCGTTKGGAALMFPTPIQKRSRAAQISYQTLLPLALIMWLLPLIAVMLFLHPPARGFQRRKLLGRAVEFRDVRQLRPRLLRQ